MTDGTKHLFLATANGMSIRFPEAEVRSMGRATTGVRGIQLRKGDEVVGMEVLEKEGAILTAAERGLGKRTDIDEYREQGRGGLGVINLKVTDRTGRVVGVCQVFPGDQVILMSEGGKLTRTGIDAIREIGRSTQGVRLMDLDADDKIAAIAKVVEREDEETPGDAGGQQTVN